MDNGTNVQDENLVNDQVAQALNDSGLADGALPAPEAVVPAPIPAPTADVTPQPLATPASDVIPQPLDATAETPAIDTGPALITDDEPEVTVAETPAVAPTGNADDDDLMTVKQKALEQLSPLVDHLDLPPDQKFDTYMEILRASDDRALVQPAFEAAQAIEDEDKKAQALLDVVNEVNYLTQDHKASE